MVGRSRVAKPEVDEDEAFLQAHLLEGEEAWKFFDSEARLWLNMSGEEFLRRWDANEFDVDGPDHVRIMSVYFLLPLVR
jgi:hypothetical protein